MRDPASEFNENARPDRWFLLEREARKLDDPVKKELWDDLRRDQKKEMTERLQDQENERIGCIADMADRHNGTHTLEFGTVREHTPIHREEVVAMMARGSREGLTLDQMRPRDSREILILMGFSDTRSLEARENRRLDDRQYDDAARHLTGLKELSIEDYTRTFGDRSSTIARDDRRWGEQGRNLSDEFDRRR